MLPGVVELVGVVARPVAHISRDVRVVLELSGAACATAYRYPTVAGRKPPSSEVLEAVEELRALWIEARDEVS